MFYFTFFFLSYLKRAKKELSIMLETFDFLHLAAIFLLKNLKLSSRRQRKIILMQ